MEVQAQAWRPRAQGLFIVGASRELLIALILNMGDVFYIARSRSATAR